MSNRAKNWVIVLALLCFAGATIAATIDMSDNHLSSGQKFTHTFWNDTVDEIAGGVNNVATGQITDGTIVNADISATADILQSKIDNDTRAIDADKVDTIHASAVATANYLYSLDSSAKFPNGVLYTGAGNGLDADKVDGKHAGTTADTVLILDGSALVPLANIPATLTGKDADTLDTYDSTAFGRLAAANTWTANQTVNATLTATELYLVSSATQIYINGSDMVFKDAVVSGGSKTLSELANGALASRKVRFSTIFEEPSQRTVFAASGGNSTSEVQVGGVYMITDTVPGYATAEVKIAQHVNQSIFAGSPVFSCVVTIGTVSSITGQAYWGMGSVTYVGTNPEGFTTIAPHIGFRAVYYSPTQYVIYGTQADGTTENLTDAFITVVANDVLDLIVVVNGTTSVDYYYRKNGGTLTLLENQTTNLPTSTNTSLYAHVDSGSGSGTTIFYLSSMSYER